HCAAGEGHPGGGDFGGLVVGGGGGVGDRVAVGVEEAVGGGVDGGGGGEEGAERAHPGADLRVLGGVDQRLLNLLVGQARPGGVPADGAGAGLEGDVPGGAEARCVGPGRFEAPRQGVAGLMLGVCRLREAVGDVAAVVDGVFELPADDVLVG